jgi:hypothetical protein
MDCAPGSNTVEKHTGRLDPLLLCNDPNLYRAIRQAAMKPKLGEYVVPLTPVMCKSPK